MVVVGAGPAGSCLALLLAQRGVPVTLVEAATRLERQFRGEALMPHGLEALEAMGLARELDALPHRALAGWRFCLDGRPLFRVAEPMEGEGQPGCLLVSQPALLAAVIARLRALGNARVLLGQRVSGLIRQQCGRISGVQLAGGEQLPASLVVACDGRQSSLREAAGLELRRRASPIDVLWFALPEAGPDPLAGDFTTMVGAEGIFSAFVSASGGLQLGWVLQAGATEPHVSPRQRLERMARQSPPELAAALRSQPGEPAEPMRLRVEVGLAKRWWCPGLLLLGDAAHPMSPVRAQGINLALRDAWVAGQLLGEALASASAQHAAPARSLDAVLARIEALRQPETLGLQDLQAKETARGLWLQRQSGLRRLLQASSGWLAPPLAHHWQRSQQPLRQGITDLASLGR
ncbi:FAD-dependent monooxygenase [Cyanobium sp. LEGE 06143]|nr:FAD-dependent monooxygenase [Cyanobium sp. LEGE 06143]